MFRLVAIFLMIFMPLQLSWAAVSEYCDHETESQHFGHHIHQHNAGTDQDKSTDTKDLGSSGVDYDCGSCQAGGSLAIGAASAALPVISETHVIEQYQGRLASSPISQPERPKWVVLA